MYFEGGAEGQRERESSSRFRTVEGTWLGAGSHDPCMRQ